MIFTILRPAVGSEAASVSVIIIVQFGPRAPSAQVVRVTLSFTLVGWVDVTAVEMYVGLST